MTDFALQVESVNLHLNGKTSNSYFSNWNQQIEISCL